MKVKKLYLFILILLALAFCCTLGNTFYEGMTNNNNSKKVVTGPQGQVIVATNKNTVQGINKREIPAGHEDLYILKSQVVPPVCPACPSVCSREESNNRPCPPCGRCPEPSFECKKVPNYNSANTNFLPRPVIADFSRFGE